MRALQFIVGAAAFWISGPATASAQDDPKVNECLSSTDAATKFAACDEFMRIGLTTVEGQRRVVVERGRANQAQGRYDAALADYTQATTLTPDDYRGYYYRARLYASFSRHALAIADYERVLTLYQATAGGTPEERQRFMSPIETALGPLRADQAVEAHWERYLTGIQSRNAYANWPSAPLDLYRQNANAPLEGN